MKMSNIYFFISACLLGLAFWAHVAGDQGAEVIAAIFAIHGILVAIYFKVGRE